MQAKNKNAKVHESDSIFPVGRAGMNPTATQASINPQKIQKTTLLG
jgi:hypothetical protein